MPEWNLENARHLLRRTAFGGPPSAEQDFFERNDSVAEAVEELLSLRGKRSKPPKNGPSRFETKRRQQAWWVQRMVKSRRPRDAMRENLVLFWHNLLVSGTDQQPDRGYIAIQNGLFREFAAGNFIDLMRRFNKDAANLYYLDGILNRASDDGVHANPNENFGREVLELFMLGVSQVASDGSDDPGLPSYTEFDVRGMARALTGWNDVDRKGVGIWNEDRWDGGRYDDDGDDLPDPITIFGEARDDWRIDDAVAGAPNDVLTKIASLTDYEGHNAVGVHLARRLWTWFAYPAPEAGMKAMLNDFADAFENGNFELKPLLRALLNHDEFYSDRAKSSTVRSPVDLVVGTLRRFRGRISKKDAKSVAQTIGNMGMDLFDPPNVAGWPGGRSWMTTANLLSRLAFARNVSDRDSSPLYVELDNIEGLPFGQAAADPDEVLDALLRVLGLDLGPAAVPASHRQILRDHLTDAGAVATLDLSTNSGTDVNVRLRGTIALAIQSPFYQIN